LPQGPASGHTHRERETPRGAWFSFVPPRSSFQEAVTLETMIEWSGLSDEDFKDVCLNWVKGSSLVQLALAISAQPFI
jgi:hypothetical protein